MKLAKSFLFGAAVALAAVGITAGSAYADDKQAKPKDNEPGFTNLDKNKDGYLSRAEAAADPDVAKNFKQIDKDKDGKISRTEYLEHKGKKDLSTLGNKVGEGVDKLKSKAKSGESSSTGSTTEKPADKP